MYFKIIDEINRFLKDIGIGNTPINPLEFESVFVKKLSNQNICREKRRIKSGEKSTKINQTHIDVTGQTSMLFFFEELDKSTTDLQEIDIDLFYNNFSYLKDVDASKKILDSKGNTVFQRKSSDIPAQYSLVHGFDKILHSSAYKKYGHTGDQVQINIPDSDETFTQFQHFAYQGDALIFLRYDYLHYLSILIPYTLSKELYKLTNTHGTKNINVAYHNPSYNEEFSLQLQRESISKDLLHDESDIQILQNNLNESSTAGSEIERIVKARVAQGAFRRLMLIEYNHKCCLCNIHTTSALRGSHIKEWSDSSPKERIDANNGLLLCANHDALFDKHLISFNPETGNIIVSISLEEAEKEALNLDETFVLDISKDMKPYIKYHYNKFSKKEGL